MCEFPKNIIVLILGTLKNGHLHWVDLGKIKAGDHTGEHYRVIEGDTRSLDYNPYNPLYNPSFHCMFHFLFHPILHY